MNHGLVTLRWRNLTLSEPAGTREMMVWKMPSSAGIISTIPESVQLMRLPDHSTLKATSVAVLEREHVQERKPFSRLHRQVRLKLGVGLPRQVRPGRNTSNP